VLNDDSCQHKVKLRLPDNFQQENFGVQKPVLLRQHSSDSTDGSLMTAEQRSEVRSMTASPQPPQGYKKFIGAEEKIQEELREMQQREEELK
jgi:hypothetical protein